MHRQQVQVLHEDRPALWVHQQDRIHCTHGLVHLWITYPDGHTNLVLSCLSSYSPFWQPHYEIWWNLWKQISMWKPCLHTMEVDISFPIHQALYQWSWADIIHNNKNLCFCTARHKVFSTVTELLVFGKWIWTFNNVCWNIVILLWELYNPDCSECFLHWDPSFGLVTNAGEDFWMLSDCPLSMRGCLFFFCSLSQCFNQMSTPSDFICEGSWRLWSVSGHNHFERWLDRLSTMSVHGILPSILM